LCFYAEDYTEDLAIAHIRRLLDIVACTNSFGPASSSPKTSGRAAQSKEPGPAEAEPSQSLSSDHGEDPTHKKPGGAQRVGGPVPNKSGPDGTERADVAAVSMYPPPRLGQFYEFFSFSHLTPPVHCELSSLSRLCACNCLWKCLCGL
jgi:protein TIF31